MIPNESLNDGESNPALAVGAATADSGAFAISYTGGDGASGGAKLRMCEDDDDDVPKGNRVPPAMPKLLTQAVDDELGSSSPQVSHRSRHSSCTPLMLLRSK
jgi:hypothetical protein